MPIKSIGLKSLISPAIFVYISEVSKDFITSIPEFPFIKLFHEASMVLPTGEIIPIPVITTSLVNKISEILNNELLFHIKLN